MKIFSLKKSRKALYSIHHLYKRKRKKLSSQVCHQFESLLSDLHAQVKKKNRDQAASLVKELKSMAKNHLPKTFLEKAFDVTTSLLFALVVALVIRQMWFEFFTIPTGSMRPTLKEGDYIVVNKADFGLNMPLNPSHFYFDSDLMERGDIIVFSTSDMDISDANMMYFYIVPGKKQFVKRLIGKPGDTVYFYGGKIYGVDKQGEDLPVLRESTWFNQIEHIPFIKFEEKVVTPEASVQGVFSPAIFYQMNEPVAKLYLNSYGKVEGRMIPKGTQAALQDYYDLWGLRNFATTRIISKNELPARNNASSNSSLFLELTHHPSLKSPHIIRDQYQRMRPGFSYSKSFVPLEETHLHKIMDNMFTSRFIVKNETAHLYGRPASNLFSPKMPGVPNGTYEFFNGIAYQITLGGIAKELPKSHPLYERDFERIQMLYNLGIDFQKTPYSTHSSRYAYFRDQSLYLLGASIFDSQDPTLQKFVSQEKENLSASYEPFLDFGPPLKEDGSIDKELVQKNGLHIPKDMYLVLGDNHSVSGDSRVFGFVPQKNIKGKASFIFWPTSSRWGVPFQPTSPWINPPKVVVWSLFFVFSTTAFVYYRRKAKYPLKFK